MTLEARIPRGIDYYPVELWDTDEDRLLGHATDLEALRALVRLVKVGEVGDDRPIGVTSR